MNLKLQQEYENKTESFVSHRDISGVVRYSSEYIEWLENRVVKKKKINAKRKAYLKGYTDGLELGCALNHSKELKHTRLPKDY